MKTCCSHRKVIKMGRDNERFYRAVLNAINDDQAMRIIHCAAKSPKSMNEIMQETNIARTTIHRKLRSMVRDDLLVVENFAISRDGKKSRLFRSRVSDIQVRYEGSGMYVIVEENPKRQSKIMLHASGGPDGDEGGQRKAPGTDDGGALTVTAVQ